MKLSLTFQNGHARVTITAEDDWEKRLLGVFAAGEHRSCEALVTCEADSHWTNGKVDRASITMARVNHDA
jgi:hypothetical protein